MKQEFKAGDKVYCPSEQVQIYTLRANDCEIYPLIINCDSFIKSFTLYGHRYNGDPFPSIFHATPENHEMLCKLYGVEFEAPPKPKTPKEVIQAMLDDGWVSVSCYVSNCKGRPNENNFGDLIISVNGEKFKSCGVMYWDCASPVDPRTGKIIIDYIDGEIVTEQS